MTTGALCGGGYLLLVRKGRREWLNLCRVDDTMTLIERRSRERTIAWVKRIGRLAKGSHIYIHGVDGDKMTAKLMRDWGLNAAF